MGRLLSAALALAFISCGVDRLPTGVSSVALNPTVQGGDDRTLFEQLPADATGVDFRVRLVEDHPFAHVYTSGFAVGGVAVGDLDGDGRPDLYLCSGPGSNRLYRQYEDFRFEDITESAGVDGGGSWSTGATLVDIDNDGDLDIYVSNYDAPNLLYVNDGRAGFSEQAGRFNLDIRDASMMAVFCDYDLDGLLDVYLLKNRYYRAEGRPAEVMYEKFEGSWRIKPKYARYYMIKQRSGRLIPAVYGRRDQLLHNETASGTGFRDVTEQAGILGLGRGLSATWWDYDRDGLPDLYVGNDFEDPDYLYRNEGNGIFSVQTESALPHTSWFSMGADAADINNDGYWDLLSADMAATTHYKEKVNMGTMPTEKVAQMRPLQFMRNALYLNTGTERFMEVAFLTGLARSDWSWAVNFADLDNDGRIDLHVNNGTARNFMDADFAREASRSQQAGLSEWEAFRDHPAMAEANRAYRNVGDLRFEDVAESWGLAQVGMSYGLAVADLDRDGDLDLVVANLEEPTSILRNRGTTGHRVLFELRGRHGNRFGIGATLEVETASGRQIRSVTTMKGYHSAREPLAHFGLGDDEIIERLTVEWPGGHVQSFERLKADRLYTITEPEDAAAATDRPDAPSTLFTRSERLDRIAHAEQSYDDYARQPLLPNKLSQLGPGMAWGDVDADGDDDLFLSGSAGHAGQLWLREADGRFAPGRDSDFRADAASEDMAPLFFDADGDGDLDLYVVSGGVECEPGAATLKDRLYLNDGGGIFARAPAGTLPDLRDSGSVAAAADFDRDDDLDLFVGGRLVPGEYPLVPASRLLRNDANPDGPGFTDVTAQVAPGLRETGMVTSALWSDVDGDGWPDLLVAHEWGPLGWWRNDRGRLVDRSREAGLAQRSGWWNGIAGRDVDGDGDIDYVATNFGLNTKYRASLEQPAFLYYGDFDQTGQRHLVEAAYEDETLYPLRGRSCSTRAMPFLGSKFTTYRDFALAPLVDIYTSERLGDAHTYAATTLESGLLVNDGRGGFAFRALPRIAQAAPGFGVLFSEVDGDPFPDLYLVQNFFSPQVETGRMDGGVSLLLRGTGRPEEPFAPVWPDRSGLIVPGDAKSLTATDLNGDVWPDFVVGVNDDRMVAFEHAGSRTNRVIGVRLEGRPANRAGVGSRVTVHLDDDTTQTAEVHAGGGYLSQSSAALVFGLGSDRRVEKVEVRWPDGAVTETPSPAGPQVVIRRSD